VGAHVEMLGVPVTIESGRYAEGIRYEVAIGGMHAEEDGGQRAANVEIGRDIEVEIASVRDLPIEAEVLAKGYAGEGSAVPAIHSTALLIEVEAI